MRFGLLIVLLALYSAKSQAQPKFIVDHSQCQPVYPYDAGPSGISVFVNKIIKPNYIFYTFDLGDQLPDLGNEELFKNTIILVPPTIHKKFSTIKIQYSGDAEFKDEILYDYWLKHGANIVFIAEHDNFYFNASNINSVTEKYGIHVNNSSVKQGDNISGNWPIGQSKWFGIDSLKFYLPASLKCSADVKAWATVDTAVVCASVAAGKGSVTVISDYEMFWNMVPGHGINFGNNARFLSAVFNELLEKGDSLELATHYDKSWLYDYRNDSKELSGYKFVDYKQVNPAHINPKDIVVFDKPTENIDWPDSVFNKIKKALIICDANSNYFGMLEKEGGKGILDVLGYEHQRLPINLIARQFGIQFSESIVCNGNINDMQLDLKGVNLLHRICEYPSYKYTGSSSIIPLMMGKKPSGKIIAWADSGSVAIDYNGLLGFDETLGPDSTIKLKNATPSTGAIMAYSNKRVFAISGKELNYQLFDADYSSLWPEFIKWLKQ